MKHRTTTAIITCKGRLHHLKQTIKKFENQGFFEIIVVDYDCPDGTYEYLQKHHPRVNAILVKNKPNFNLADARNIGAKAATSENLLFVDADIIMHENALSEMERLLGERNYVRIMAQKNSKRFQNQTEGTVLVKRKDFFHIGAYDVVFDSWGGEDTDLYNRLDENKITQTVVENNYFSSIPHGDDLRTKFQAFNGLDKKNRKKTRIITKVFSEFRRLNIKLDENDRSSIKEQIRKMIFFNKNKLKFHSSSSIYLIKFQRRYLAFGPIKIEVKVA